MKPASKFKTPRPSDPIAEAVAKETPVSAGKPIAPKDDAPISVKRRPKMDMVTEALGEIGYHNQRRFPWLVYNFGGKEYALDVMRYYEESKIGIDICLPESMRNLIEVKTKLFHEHGMEYYHVDTLDQMNEIISSRNGRGLH